MGTQDNPVFTLDSEFSDGDDEEEVIYSPTTGGQQQAAKHHDEEDEDNSLSEKTPFIQSRSSNSTISSNSVQLSW